MDRAVFSKPAVPCMSIQELVRQAATIGVSYREALQVAWDLYMAGYITYPKNAGATLPLWAIEDVPEVLSAINKHAPSLSLPSSLVLNSSFFQDEQISPHHALVPCALPSFKLKPISALGPNAQAVYNLIAQAYISCVSQA